VTLFGQVEPEGPGRRAPALDEAQREEQRALRRVRAALPGITVAMATRIAALDLAIRRTMHEPR
jgi:hypothetical protein